MEVQRALQENSTARCPVLGAQYDGEDVSCSVLMRQSRICITIESLHCMHPV